MIAPRRPRRRRVRVIDVLGPRVTTGRRAVGDSRRPGDVERRHPRPGPGRVSGGRRHAEAAKATGHERDLCDRSNKWRNSGKSVTRYFQLVITRNGTDREASGTVGHRRRIRGRAGRRRVRGDVHGTEPAMIHTSFMRMNYLPPVFTISTQAPARLPPLPGYGGQGRRERLPAGSAHLRLVPA